MLDNVGETNCWAYTLESIEKLGYYEYWTRQDTRACEDLYKYESWMSYDDPVVKIHHVSCVGYGIIPEHANGRKTWELDFDFLQDGSFDSDDSCDAGYYYTASETKIPDLDIFKEIKVYEGYDG